MYLLTVSLQQVELLVQRDQMTAGAAALKTRLGFLTQQKESCGHALGKTGESHRQRLGSLQFV